MFHLHPERRLYREARYQLRCTALLLYNHSFPRSLRKFPTQSTFDHLVALLSVAQFVLRYCLAGKRSCCRAQGRIESQSYISFASRFRCFLPYLPNFLGCILFHCYCTLSYKVVSFLEHCRSQSQPPGPSLCHSRQQPLCRRNPRVGRGRFEL